MTDTRKGMKRGVGEKAHEIFGLRGRCERVLGANHDKRRRRYTRQASSHVVANQRENRSGDGRGRHRIKHLAGLLHRDGIWMVTKRRPGSDVGDITVRYLGHSPRQFRIAFTEGRQDSLENLRTNVAHIERRRVAEHHANDSLITNACMVNTEPGQAHSTHGMAENDGVAEIEMRQHGGNVVPQHPETEAIATWTAAAVTSPVQGEHPKLSAEVEKYVVEQRCRQGHTMEQQDGWRVDRTVFDDVQLTTIIRIEQMVPCADRLGQLLHGSVHPQSVDPASPPIRRRQPLDGTVTGSDKCTDYPSRDESGSTVSHGDFAPHFERRR